MSEEESSKAGEKEKKDSDKSEVSDNTSQSSSKPSGQSSPSPTKSTPKKPSKKTKSSGDRKSKIETTLINRTSQAINIDVRLDDRPRMFTLTGKATRTLSGTFFSPHAEQLRKEKKIIVKTSS